MRQRFLFQIIHNLGKIPYLCRNFQIWKGINYLYVKKEERTPTVGKGLDHGCGCRGKGTGSSK